MTKRFSDSPQLAALSAAGTEVIPATSLDGGTDTGAGTVAAGSDIKITLAQLAAYLSAGNSGGQSVEAALTKPTLAGATLTRTGASADATLENYEKGVRIRCPATTSNANDLRYILWSVTGFTSNLDVRMRVIRSLPFFQWVMCGLQVRNAAGASKTFGLGADANIGIYRNEFAGDTAWSGVSSVAIGYLGMDFSSLWLRLNITGSTWNWYISKDGYYWQLLLRETISSFKPAHVGLFINPNGGGISGAYRNEVAVSMPSLSIAAS